MTMDLLLPLICWGPFVMLAALGGLVDLLEARVRERAWQARLPRARTVVR